MRNALKLPVAGHSGAKLKYVSPYEIITSVALRDYILGMNSRDTDAKSEGKEFEQTSLDKSIWNEVLLRYALFREVTFDPREPVIGSEPIALIGSRDRFMQEFFKTTKALTTKNEVRGQSLADQLGVLVNLPGPLSVHSTDLMQSFDGIRRLVSAAFVDPKEFLGNRELEPLEPDEPPTVEELEPLVIRFKNAADKLAKELKEKRDDLNEQSGGLSSSQYKSIKPMFQEMYVKTLELKGMGQELHLALYENSNLAARFGGSRSGNMLAVVPAFNAQALANSRDTTKISQPWIGLTSLLYGSGELLEAYDSQQVESVRTSWAALRKAYRNGDATEDAQLRFSDSLRKLGLDSSAKRPEFVRENLSAKEVDQDLLAYTAYPPNDGIRIATEVRYNTTDPFQQCWVICFIASMMFGLSFVVWRRTMFWGGILFLLLAIGIATLGFYMRVVITGWAPVTNMYETVVFVPWFICVLGFIFLMMPLIDRGRTEGWRASAFPFTWEAADLTKEQQETMSGGVWNALNIVSVFVRVPVMAFLFYILTMQNVYDGNKPIFSGMNVLAVFSEEAAVDEVVIEDGFVVDTGSSVGEIAVEQNASSQSAVGSVVQSVMGGVQTVMVFLVKLVVLCLTVLLLPRLTIAIVYTILFCLKDWIGNAGITKNMSAIYDRSFFGVAATIGGTLFFVVASNADANVLNENFSPLMPILRSNVWLTIHVLTIVASYGAGMLAWMLGVLALGFYMFGKYRKPIIASPAQEGFRPASHTQVAASELSYRAPEQCGVLANYCYRAIQIAVLLLAVGTILGGLWADVSWGRFWGWDPKEVWALISLLVYLAILHGRYAGMFNNFGLCVGTILGFSAIVFSWYGVNFMLPMLNGGGAVGLHSYGSGGAGSTAMVVGFVGFNLVYLCVAAVRFQMASTFTPSESDVEEVIVPEVIVPEVVEDNMDSTLVPQSFAWKLLSFQGRISRRTYWGFSLLSAVIYYAIMIGLAVVFEDESPYILTGLLILNVSLIWISLALQIKRWHDLDKSGWWVLVGMIPLIGLIIVLIQAGCFRGTDGPNQYGADPA